MLPLFYVHQTSGVYWLPSSSSSKYCAEQLKCRISHRRSNVLTIKELQEAGCADYMLSLIHTALTTYNTVPRRLSCHHLTRKKSMVISLQDKAMPAMLWVPSRRQPLPSPRVPCLYIDRCLVHVSLWSLTSIYLCGMMHRDLLSVNLCGVQLWSLTTVRSWCHAVFTLIKDAICDTDLHCMVTTLMIMPLSHTCLCQGKLLTDGHIMNNSK